MTEYDITTASDVTFLAVITLMNAEVAGAYFHLVGGELRCTSETNGSTSTIALLTTIPASIINPKKTTILNGILNI